MDKVWLVTGSASGLGRIAGNSRFLPLAAEKAGVRFGAGAAKRADGKSVTIMPLAA
jgi:hypothetical protein